ncbi:unnamed protein product [Prunus armeniaca]
MLLLVIHIIIALTGNVIQCGVGMARVRGIFIMGCDVAQFTRQDFCLITGLRFGEVPEVSSGEKEAFLRCTEEDDIYKLALVYFVELVVLGRVKHLNINVNYLTLAEDLDAFNRYPWGSVSFDKTQDSLFSAPTKYMKSFENEEGRGKGKSKVTGTSQRNEKGKKDKHGEVQRVAGVLKIWVYELIPRMADLNYCKVVDPTDIPRILRWRTTTFVPEMRKLNNYFFQSKEDRPAVVLAESIPSSCADLDELNKVVSLLSEGEELQRKSSKGEDPQRKRREGKEVKRQRSEEKEVQRNQCEEEHDEVMLLGDDIGESTEGTKVEFTLGDIDLDQPTTVLSQLNVWLNDEGKTVEQGVQLRKRKRIIPMWKILEASELVQKTLLETTELQMLDLMKEIPHDDMVKLLKLCWEWHHNPNLVMQFGNVEVEIEFFASLIKADGWLKGDHIDLGLYLIWKRQQELEEVEISDWTTTDVFFMNTYKVYAPCMLMKYKHWVALMIDLVLCEIKVYDSMISLIPYEILKEELAPLSITIPNLLNSIDFYEEGVYANDCRRDWWCSWPIERVNVPQQSNQGDCGMFVLKYIELLSVEIPLDTCTS